MGTSTSSSGPGPAVSLDPPWLDDIAAPGAASSGNVEPAEPTDGSGHGDAPTEAEPVAGVLPPALAPTRRFGAARTSLSAFLRSGDTRALGRAIGHYSRTGMGGAGRAATRMRAATRAGAGLISFLNATSIGTDAQATEWVRDLLARDPSVAEVVDAIVEAVMPAGGSADEESIRDSMAIALSDLMTIVPECDPLHMSVDDTWTLMQLYLSQEVCNRLRFDMGQAFESATLDPATVVQRELEMRQFVRNEIGVQLGVLRDVTPNPTRPQLDRLMQDAVRLMLQVYEGDL